MKEFKDILLARQSCRNYSSKPVSKDDIMTCIASAGLAPSACNSQPWKFVVVTDDEKRMQFAKLLQIIGFNLWAENAPVLVAVCEEAEPKLMPAVLKRWDCKHYSQFDLGLATQNFISQAAELGLSSCIIGTFDEKEVGTLLEIPKNETVKIVIALGYGENDTPRQKTRKPIEEIARFI